ncbi:hypothetical protein M9458_003508, partial [Cirrhinus mrigala]
RHDGLIDQTRAATLSEPAPPGGLEGKCYVPTTIRLALLDSVHTSPGSGHPGSQQTLSLLRNRYWVPSMARYVNGCLVCAITSTPRRLPEGFTTILVVVDRFSKACKLIPLKGLPTALETAEALFHHVFRHPPISLKKLVWRGFFHLLGVSVSLSSGYHPETNDQTERKVQEIRRYQNTPKTPSVKKPQVPAVNYWFRESERVWDSAHVHLQRAVRRHKDYANAHHSPTPLYQPGNRGDQDIRLQLPSRKLSPRYIGPFPFSRQINDVIYELTLPEHYCTAPTFHVSFLKPFINPLLPPSTEHDIPPPPEVDTNKTIYRVRQILDSQRRGGWL